MGTNTLTDKSSTDVIDENWVNNTYTALKGNFVPRNVSTGAPINSTYDLGTPLFKWKNLYIDGNFYIGSSALDLELYKLPANRILSGQTTTGSSQPDFIRASGAATSFTVEATTTTLVTMIDNATVEVTADFTKTGLTTAPATNNTCLINNSSFDDQEQTKYAGEESGIITIDSVGSEISDRVGQYVCLKAATEYLFGYVKSATEIANCYRGYFFDSSGNPIEREVLSDNDTLTLMSLGWIYLSSAGNSVDVSYTNPLYSYTTPPASFEVTGNYWYDLGNETWKRWDGSIWENVSRTLIGLAVVDGTACVATRSFDFYNPRQDTLTFEVEVLSSTEIGIKENSGSVFVYDKLLQFDFSGVTWDITTDLEAGLTEQSDFTYYLYITEVGVPKISDKRPYNRKDLKGYYHPYETWRCVGTAINESGDFSKAFTSAKGEVELYYTATTDRILWLKPVSFPAINTMRVFLLGGEGALAPLTTFGTLTNDNLTLADDQRGMSATVAGTGIVTYRRSGSVTRWLGQYNAEFHLKAKDFFLEEIEISTGEVSADLDGGCIIHYY